MRVVNSKAQIFVTGLVLSTLSPLATAFASSNALNAETDQVRTTENIARISKGMAIYQYYQGNNFAALTQLALNDKRAIIDHSGNSELFKAGLQLHFQMNAAAGDIFAQQLLQQANAGSNLAYRDLVYLSFAKALYKKQQYQQAKQALAHIGNNLASEHQDDYHFLNAQLLLKLGDVNGASAAQQQISAASIYHRYLAFNQAMLLIANKQTAQAISTLAKVTTIQQPVLSQVDEDENEQQAVIEAVITDELEALLDRANLAIAYLSLEQDQNRQAIDAFKRVRIDGIDSEAAMLGYGWAAANSSDYQTALMVWQQLSSHKLLTPYVLEAYVAIGYAYEEMNDSKSAYAAYHLAVAKFEQQQQLLDIELTNIYGNTAANEAGNEADITASTNNGYILSLLQPETVNATSSTVESSQNLSAGTIGAKVELVLPPAINTFALVASNEFQQGLDDLNNVNASITLLNGWQQQLAQMADKFYRGNPATTTGTSVTTPTIAELSANSPLSKADETKLRQAQLAELAHNYQAINAKLNQQAFAMVGKLFKADPVIGQRQQLLHSYQQYQTLSRKLAEQPQDDNYPALKARLERLAGLLLWQIGDYYLDADGQYDKSLANNAKIKLQQSQQLGLSPVADMQYQVNHKLAVASSLQQRLLTNLQTSLGQSLAEQRHDLDTYLEKARTAIVHLNDEVFIHQHKISEQRQPLSPDAEQPLAEGEGANDES